jgi:serine/threonine protein kinase
MFATVKKTAQNNKNEEVTLPDLEIVRVIGKGAFGVVFEALDKTNNRKVALKMVEKVGN